MALSIGEMRNMSSKVFDAIEAGGMTELAAEEGWYWCIGSEQAWNMQQEPALMTGDLADDITDIRKDLSEYHDIAAPLAWHTLDHLIGVLTATSQELKARHIHGNKEDQ